MDIAVVTRPAAANGAVVAGPTEKWSAAVTGVGAASATSLFANDVAPAGFAAARAVGPGRRSLVATPTGRAANPCDGDLANRAGAARRASQMPTPRTANSRSPGFFAFSTRLR